VNVSRGVRMSEPLERLEVAASNRFTLEKPLTSDCFNRSMFLIHFA